MRGEWCRETELFDARPGQVDVEEEEEDAQAEDGALGRSIGIPSIIHDR
jgi:hypothetical protein